VSGCTNCKGKSGCDDRKGPMIASIEETIERLYPTRVWGEATDVPMYGSAGDPDLLDALTEELGQELNAATFAVRGNDDETCDYIYILCVGRTPCIMQMRDHQVALAPHADVGDAPVLEMYLRVVISHRANICAVQQVAMELIASDDGYLVRESPRAGVYDPPLLKRMQKLVAILPAYELMHVDFGEIAHSPPGFTAGTWTDRYGGKPSIANFFFYPQPTTMVTTTLLSPAHA